MKMIYTIGHTKSYLQYFKEQGQPKKLGRNKDYIGGSVFKTKEEAKNYLDIHNLIDYSVFGVAADWEKDTIEHENELFHDLLVTSNLVKL